MQIGPYLFPPMVFAVLVGIIVLMVLTHLLTRRVGKQFDHWLTVALLSMGAAARLGFVMPHWSSFSQEPWRIFYIWQGGFEWAWGLAAGLVSLLFLKGWSARGLGLGALTISLAVAYVAFSFTPKTPAHPLPDMPLATLDGGTKNLVDYSHEAVVLNIWATWCGPCRREMPMLEQAIKDYPQIRFLFINQGESQTTVEKYLVSEGLEMQEAILLDSSQAVAQRYETLGTPTTLFFKDNQLKATHIGELSAERLKEYLQHLQ